MHKQIRHSATGGCVCLLLAGLAIAALPALSMAADEAGKNKALYAQKLQEIKQESDAAKAEVTSRYRKSLDQLRQSAKQKGDLDGLQAVDAEIKRFEKQKSLPPATPPSVNPDLAKFVALCHETLDKADLDGARKVIELTDRYMQFLDLHKRQAVRDDNLVLAKAFDNELKAARETPEYQAAKFVVAEKGAAEAPKTETPDASAATEPKPTVTVSSNVPPVLSSTRAGPNGEKIQPRVDPDGLYDAQRLVEGPPAAALGTPSSYKQLTAFDTGKAPLSGGVGIAMDGYLESDSARYQLRIRLRTKMAATNFVNLKVLAQYFVKNPGGGLIQEARLQVALVSNLATKGFTCELKPAELPGGYSYRFRGGGFMEDRDGAFQGVVVSVFSLDDKLLGQVASASMLKDRARTAFELPPSWLDHVYDTMPVPNSGGVTRPRRRRPPEDGG